jgi:predicted  nucleic acid-binding Zn-ribbon protein
MADQIKFTEEEMNKIKEVQKEYQQKTAMFGQLSFQKFQLERQVETAAGAETALKKEIIDLEQQERALVKELNDKYGAGTLDPKTGEFKPAQL